MKTLAIPALLLLSGFIAFGQDSSDLFQKAPPAIDDALRARVNEFYTDFIAGKFKAAYALVADDSEDKFFELSKDQYKSCEIIRINYSDQFTKATVITSCKTDWRWHGVSTMTTFPLTSTWEVIDGQWFWHYTKPTVVPSPFSPTGYIPVPKDTPENQVSVLPSVADAAKGILSKIGVDKNTVRLSSSVPSEDIVHLRNDMPGEVSVEIQAPQMPGLKVSLGKTTLEAHEETAVLFQWQPDTKCADCAKRITARPTVQIRIAPTAQVFPITVLFDAPQAAPQPTAKRATAPPQISIPAQK